MKTRQILTLAVLVPLVAGLAPADAAKRKPVKKPRAKVPTCNLVTDKKDDATGNGSGIVESSNDPSSDIVSADIATTAQWVTAVIRLSSVDANTTGSPTGRAYDFSFLAHDKVVVLRAIVSPAGNVWYDGKGQGAVDTTGRLVKIHVPVSQLGIPLKPNDKLGDLKATSWRWVGTAPISLGLVDNAVGAKPYVSAWPSCVKVGP